MNKILVTRNNIISDYKEIEINNKEIKIKTDGIYFIEYSDIIDIDLDIYVDNGANVTLYENAFLDDIRVNNRYVIKDGELRVNKFYNNNSVVEKIDIDLCSFNSKIDYRFSNICKNNESYLININHKSKNTISNVNNKSIALEGSKLDFVINSVVKKEYENSVLDQNTRIVTFGDCDTSVSPNMYIDCDLVSAKHGSVIGTFKDELVFYLMSRGIEYTDALKLLIKGYLFSNIDAVNEIREKILNVMDKYWR